MNETDLKIVLATLLKAIREYKAAAITPGGKPAEADRALDEAMKDAKEALEG
jgi:hypothetical protein